MIKPGPQEQFAIMPVYDRPPAGSIFHGSMSAVMEHVVDSQTRNDSQQLLRDAASALGVLEEVEAKEDALRERQVRAFCDSVATLSRRLDALEARRRAQARRDAEAEAKAIADYIDSLPDPDDPNQGGELSPVGPSKYRDPAAAEADELPDPDDPTGVSLKKDQGFGGGTTPSHQKVNDPAELGRVEPVPAARDPAGVSLHEGG
jgi:hypothetical protein